MTEYKKGDEVLVRMIVDKVSDQEGDVVLYTFSADGVRRIAFCRSSQIYSLAPEFEVGERIDVSDDNETWVRGLCFVGIDNNNPYPYLVRSTYGTIWHYKSARKLTPKDKPVTIKEMVDYSMNHSIIDTFKHFKNRRIGGDK